MKIHQEITLAVHYTNMYAGEYFNHYQIHIFSFNKVHSAYYDTKSTTVEQVRDRAKHFITEIIAHSQAQVEPALFERNGKFLITFNKEILDSVELFEFDPDYVRYEPCYDFGDLFEFIESIPIDVFMKNALVSVGAEELYGEIENQVKKLIEQQNSDISYHAETRTSDKHNPKFLVEIYKIEKDYKPFLVEQLQSNNFERTIFLPEHRYIMKMDSRYAFKAIDIATKEMVADDIADAIERIRHTKYLRKHPPTIDMESMQRMELDSDDPNFLSWEDYTANDDEYEEGDDDYTPRH